MDAGLYRYRALVRSVYDGDTCTVDIDLGLGCWVHGEKIRLYRINAPEYLEGPMVRTAGQPRLDGNHETDAWHLESFTDCGNRVHHIRGVHGVHNIHLVIKD